MSLNDETIITIVRDPFDPISSGKKGCVKFKSIKNSLEWSNFYTLCGMDGIEQFKLLPSYFLRCKFWCDELIGEYRGHTCGNAHGNPPHHIYSFILANDNKEIFNELIKIAGEKPKAKRAKPVPHKLCENCAEDIIDALINNKEHKALKYSKDKRCRYIVRKNLDPVMISQGTQGTKNNIGKRVNKILLENIKSYPQIKWTLHGPWMAFIVSKE